MRTAKFVVLSVLCAILGAGCAASTDVSPEDSNPATDDTSLPTTDDIATYRQLVIEVQEGASTYRAGMMDLGTATGADCQWVYEQYDAEVRPWVSEMIQLSRRMDRYMDYYGGGDVADHVCVSAAMAYELDRHHSAACASPNLALNQEEAGRHVDAMLAYGQHMRDRCDQMMHASDSGDWGWAPMMDGCTESGQQCAGMTDHDCRGGMMGELHGRACCDG